AVLSPTSSSVAILRCDPSTPAGNPWDMYASELKSHRGVHVRAAYAMQRCKDGVIKDEGAGPKVRGGRVSEAVAACVHSRRVPLVLVLLGGFVSDLSMVLSPSTPGTFERNWTNWTSTG
ncbi:hypothetical protein ACJ73_06487, partial [Blastomyces percursus]